MTTIGMLLLMCTAARGFGRHAGIHGITWASSAGDHEHLTRVRGDGPVRYYVNRNMIYRAANQPVPGVIYGFFQDRLFAVYIKLRSPNQVYYLEKRFRAEYGAAKVKMNKAGNRTIYRWKKDDIKIKLKIEENDRDLKLGIDYIPIAAQLNQALLEEAPSTLHQRAPAKDPSTVSAPLL
jgi:hypothetical protein